MQNVAKYVVLLAMAQFICCNLIYDYYKIDDIWFISNALTHFLLAVALRMVIDSAIVTALDFFTFNMLIDELTGTALAPCESEYTMAVIFIAIISLETLFKTYARNTNGISN